MTLEEIDNIKINFIVGAGRSGTTLLVAILNEYENCISSNEIHHFIRFYKKYHNVTHYNEELKKDYEDYLDFFFSKPRILIGERNDELFKALKIGQAISYSQITKLIYLGLFGTKGIKNEINIIVDKNPYFSFQIEKIMNVFPEAKIIALVRDYRDYVLSNIQSKGSGFKNKTAIYHAYVWRLINSIILKNIDKFPNNIIVIKYEDLVIKKEKSLKLIASFFGMNYNTIVFDFYKDVRDEGGLTERNHQRLIDLSFPINSNKIGAWQNGLSKTDIQKADVICSDIAKKFGYFPKQIIPTHTQIQIKLISLLDRFRVFLFGVFKTPNLRLYYKTK